MFSAERARCTPKIGFGIGSIEVTSESVNDSGDIVGNWGLGVFANALRYVLTPSEKDKVLPDGPRHNMTASMVTSDIPPLNSCATKVSNIPGDVEPDSANLRVPDRPPSVASKQLPPAGTDENRVTASTETLVVERRKTRLAADANFAGEEAKPSPAHRNVMVVSTSLVLTKIS